MLLAHRVWMCRVGRECVHPLVESPKTCVSELRVLQGKCVEAMGIQLELRHEMASRLVALSKNPGVHPIGGGEVCCRVIGKAAMTVIRQDVIEITGCQQLCAGQ